MARGGSCRRRPQAASSRVEPTSRVVARRRSRGCDFVVRPAAMHRVAVVPDHQVADPPFVAVDELPLRRVLVQVGEQQPALRHRPADDVRGVRRQVQRLAARSRVPPHQPLARRRVLLALARREFGKADLAARPEHVVLDDEIVERGFLRLAQRVIGGAHVGELGLAGAERRGRRHRHREQHAEHHRHRHVGRVGVPQPVAEAVEPPAVVAGAQPVVLVEVRDVADLRDREAPLAAARRRAADLQFAEPGGEIVQLPVGQLLVVEHQDGLAVDRPPDLLDCGVVDRLGADRGRRSRRRYAGAAG